MNIWYVQYTVEDHMEISSASFYIFTLLFTDEHWTVATRLALAHHNRKNLFKVDET
jgi:hypothetical protein